MTEKWLQTSLEVLILGLMEHNIQYKWTFPGTGLSNSPPPPDGSCTGCISTDPQPAGWGVLLRGKPGRVPGLGGCTGPATLSTSQTTGARTRAICCPFHLHSHLMLCQQLAFFTPGTRLTPPLLAWDIKALGSAGYSSDFLRGKQTATLPWNIIQTGIIYHKPSSKLHSLLTVMTRFASPLFMSVFE